MEAVVRGVNGAQEWRPRKSLPASEGLAFPVKVTLGCVTSTDWAETRRLGGPREVGTGRRGAGRSWRQLCSHCHSLAPAGSEAVLSRPRWAAQRFQGSPGRCSDQALGLVFLVVVPGLACVVPTGGALWALSDLAVGLGLAKRAHEVSLAALGKEQTGHRLQGKAA